MKFLGIFLILFSSSLQANEFLKIEIHCKDSFKALSLKELCPDGEPCRWRAKEKSKTATSWQRGQKELEVIEVPNQKLVRIKYYKGMKLLPLPWCGEERRFSWKILNQNDLEAVKKAGGTLYLISPKSQGTWKMLHEIKHPCRKLIKQKDPSGLSWLYLKPSKKKACQ